MKHIKHFGADSRMESHRLHDIESSHMHVSLSSLCSEVNTDLDRIQNGKNNHKIANIKHIFGIFDELVQRRLYKSENLGQFKQEAPEVYKNLLKELYEVDILRRKEYDRFLK